MKAKDNDARRFHHMPQQPSPLSAFLLERFLNLLPVIVVDSVMASSEALQKFEQAKAFIEEARALVEEKNGADAV